MNDVKPLILIVEDDKHLSRINSYVLESEGYKVIQAFTLDEARSALLFNTPNVILLDVKLPDGSGFDFCREIRETTDAHIIFLTSAVGSLDEMEGLIAGGDEYLRKPYRTELLRERVKKVLSKQEKEKESVIKRGNLTLDYFSGKVFINDVDINLSKKEFSLLLLFMQEIGKVQKADFLYDKIWGQPMNDNPQAIKSAISRLRAKLEESGYTIINEYGGGYRFDVC